jgi:hypothetical protein
MGIRDMDMDMDRSTEIRLLLTPKSIVQLVQPHARCKIRKKKASIYLQPAVRVALFYFVNLALGLNVSHKRQIRHRLEEAEYLRKKCRRIKQKKKRHQN